MLLINKKVFVSNAEYFTDKDAINALMDSSILVDHDKAQEEHALILKAFESAGIDVHKVGSPKDCQDGIYIANWGLIRGSKVVPSKLPNKRKPEEAYARKVFQDNGLEILELPPEITAFSGQGDSLACDDVLFCQSPYRTSLEAHEIVKKLLGFNQVLSLRTKPQRWFGFGPAKTNKLTGWPDSQTYDLDLALAVLRPKTDSSLPLIAYCPAVFNRHSLKQIESLKNFDKITISKKEALTAFAANLVSTGETAIIGAGAPLFKAELVKHGLKVIELDLPELKKGGGSIRCCSLTFG